MKSFEQFINEGQRFLRSIGKNDNVIGNISYDDILTDLKADTDRKVVFKNEDDNMFYDISLALNNYIVVIPERQRRSIEEILYNFELFKAHDIIKAWTHGPTFLCGSLRKVNQENFGSMLQIDITGVETEDNVYIIKFRVIE